MLSIRLPETIENRLDNLAKTTGRTKSFYVKELLIRYLDDLEDIYLAERTVERIRKGEEKVYSSEEVEKLLAVED